MLSHISGFIVFMAFANAWAPGHRNMTALDGNDLFEREPSGPLGLDPTSVARRWLPGGLPIRGVNLGSLFIIEPWMAWDSWVNVVQCPQEDNRQSEFDCVSAIGQEAANERFKNHWSTFITEADLDEMIEFGLNTIRIPIGYWIFENLKYESEHFPEGALPFLEQVCGWAADRGFYVIIDLHGAPFGQTEGNAFTGQLVGKITNDEPRFYQQSQYDRALSFLDQMTRLVHGSDRMRNVGMIEILNEPQRLGEIPDDLLESMRRDYYPAAFRTIRGVEQELGIQPNDYLHIQMMNGKWNSGDPAQYIPDLYFAAYDDHRYPKWDDSVEATQQGYITASCNDDRSGNTPTITGEWSLSVADAVEKNGDFWPVENHLEFYQRWFGAQTRAYERQEGWIYWSWKTQLGDPRWSYRDAVIAGLIPRDLSQTINPC